MYQSVDHSGGLPQDPNAYYSLTASVWPHQVNGNSHGAGFIQQDIFDQRTSTSSNGNAGQTVLTNNHPGHSTTIAGMQANLPARPAQYGMQPALVGPPTTHSNNNAFPNNNNIHGQNQMPTLHTNTIPPTMSNPPAPATRMYGSTNVSTRAGNPNQVYGNQIVGRPPHNVAPPLNIDISMVEICTFCPSWFLIPEVAMRAQQNGWTRKALAMAQFDATNTYTNISPEAFVIGSSRIQKQTSLCGTAMFNVKTWSSEVPKQQGYTGNQDLTANNWHLKSDHLGSKKQETFGHVALRDIYQQVQYQRWPQGEDRMILTKCLEFAHNNPHLDLDTSHYGWIIQFLGLVPDGGLHNATHDLQAVARLISRLPAPPPPPRRAPKSR